MPVPAPFFRRCVLPLAVFAAALMAQWLLARNPGWFSHDELQWAAFADVPRLRDLPWAAWTGIDALQWRPLTFNLWLPLAWALGDAPLAWHTLWVALGSALAAWLAVLLRGLGVAAWPAAIAALVFALGPYAVYVHGWVGTLGDLLVAALGLGLAQALIMLRDRVATVRWRDAVPAAVAAFVLTTLALMAKESAIAWPAVLLLCALLWPRERVFAAATVGAGIAAVAYLVLRLPALLAPGSVSEYTMDPAFAPKHWAAYHLFVLRPSTFEVAGLWRASLGSLAPAALCWLLLWAGIARTRPRLALALLGGGTLLLAPVLPIAISANQYGYLFSLWCVAVVALAWAGSGRWLRGLVLLVALAAVWHGANVQREMRAAGERQAVFQPALAAELQARTGVVRLHAPEKHAWLYGRLTRGVRGIDGRVQWVDDPAQADVVVGDDGTLSPAPR